MRVLVLFGVFPLAAWTQNDDAAVWSEFAQWIEVSAPRAEAGRVHLQTQYLQHLRSKGVPELEALRRIERINVFRRGNLERDKIYWNGVFKLGDGPGAPSRLVVEFAQGSPAGKALDVAMGNGRNAVFLAAAGWDVTGYDAAPGALAAANRAREANVRATFIESTHETFDFGRERWDLVILAYVSSIGEKPVDWPAKIWDALKPGGQVIYYTSNPARALSSLALASPWGRFRLLRFEDIEDFYDGWDRPGVDGKPGKGREIRIVAEKPR
jgi:2-polyprenyl-3-methyl-5-hydroxy-6-metoxy-1,4-benzoquinol methylase